MIARIRHWLPRLVLLLVLAPLAALPACITDPVTRTLAPVS